MKNTLKVGVLALVIATMGIIALSLVACKTPDSDPPSPPPVVHTPVVNAPTASNASPTLASGLTITLTGSATIDDDSALTYQWSTQSAPVTPTITTPDAASTTVTGLTKAGAYVFKLTAASAAGVAGSNTVTVNVQPMTKTITVPAITTVSNPLNFGAVSALSGWDTNFPASDVTYTLTLSQGGVTKATVNSTSATTISATGQPNGVYTITQTFFYKGNPISGGSRSAAVDIVSNAFNAGSGIAVSETDFSVGSFVSITLNLSKDSL